MITNLKKPLNHNQILLASTLGNKVNGLNPGVSVVHVV